MKADAVPSLFQWNSYQLPKSRKSPMKRQSLNPENMEFQNQENLQLQVVEECNFIEEGTYDVPLDDHDFAQENVIE